MQPQRWARQTWRIVRFEIGLAPKLRGEEKDRMSFFGRSLCVYWFFVSFLFFLLDYLHQEFRKENLLVQYGRREVSSRSWCLELVLEKARRWVLVYGWVECKGDVLGK
jgi:hypothetical protein